MQNYKSVVDGVASSFQSLIVPADQEEEAKAQITRGSGYEISKQNPNIGLLSKPGGNQVMGYSVDVLIDKSDGSWVDCCTAQPRSGGMVEIIPLWLPNGPDTTPGWIDRWRQATEALANAPGPLVPKDVPDPPDPEPGPDPVPDNAIMEELKEIKVLLAALSAQQKGDTTTTLAAIDTFEARFNQVVEDAEETLEKLLPIIIAGGGGSGGLGDLLGGLLGKMRSKTEKVIPKEPRR